LNIDAVYQSNSYPVFLQRVFFIDLGTKKVSKAESMSLASTLQQSFNDIQVERLLRRSGDGSYTRAELKYHSGDPRDSNP
jgi:hypothetical protein